jgi:hypothetical protein
MILRRRTLEMAASLIALGLDPDKCTLFVQSHRPEVTELCWLFNTVTPVGWLLRTPTYKEKRANQPDDINHGLLTYPVLQAADIVLYKASLVPVGKDQAAHLELSREIVRAFNARYGETFPEPKAVYTEAPVVLGTDGVKKMSKSVGNTIEDPGRAGRDPQAGHVDGHGHAADHALGPGPASGLQRLPDAPPSSATTTRRSGRASEPLEPAASTPRSCWPSGSSPTTPPPERPTGSSWPTPLASTESSKRARSASGRSPRPPWPKSARRWVCASIPRQKRGQRSSCRDERASPPQPGLHLSRRDHRWLSALLILATLAVGFVVVDYVGKWITYFGDVIMVFFLAWLLAFILSPVANGLVRLFPRLPGRWPSSSSMRC